MLGSLIRIRDRGRALCNASPDGARRSPNGYVGLVRASFDNFFVRLLSAGILLLAELMVARLIGAESYGVYVFVLALVALAGVVSSVGLDIAAKRFVATISEKADTRLFWAFVRFSRRRVLLVSIVIAGIVIVSSTILARSSEFELQLPLVIGAGVLVCLSLSQIDQAILYGLRRSVLAELPTGVVRPGLVILLGIAWWISGAAATAETALLWTLIAAATSLLFVRLLIRRAAPGRASNLDDTAHHTEWRSTANAMILGAVAGVVLDRTGVVLLGLTGNVAAAGQFGASVRLSALLVFFLVAVNSILGPMIATANERRSTEELQGLVTFASRIIFVATLAAAMILAVAGEWLLALFGSEFVTAYPVLMVLLAGQVVNAFAGPVILLLNMTGHQRDTARILMLSAGLNVLLTALSIPKLGAVGAAMAASISMAVWNIALSFVVRKRLGVVTFALPWPFLARRGDRDA